MSPPLMNAIGLLLISIGIMTAMIGGLMMYDADHAKGSGTLNVRSSYEEKP